MNLIDASVIAEEDGVYLRFGNYKVKLSAAVSELLLKSGYKDKEVILGIRPENIAIDQGNNSEALSLKLDLMENLGSENIFYFELMDSSLVVKAGSGYMAGIGSHMSLRFDMDKIHIFDKDTKEAVF